MNKFIKILAVCLIVTLIFLSTVFANEEIKVSIDGEYLEFDVAPQIINDRTMVPLRAIFEALRAEVDWDSNTQTVTAMKNDVCVTATIGNKKMYIDDEEKIMDVAPVLTDGRTLVPVRFVAEAFDCEVEWDSKRRTVYITGSEPEENFYFADQD